MTRSLTFAILALFALIPPPARTEVVAIRAGRLIDPATGIVSTNQIILVDGRNIRAVGRDIEIPPSARVIDLSAATVLPGLFDCHTHLCMRTNPQGREHGDLFFYDQSKTSAFRALQGVQNAREMLDAGFTTVRDVGNAGMYIDTDLRRAIETGVVPGPTVINAGRIIAPFGGQYHLQPERPHAGEPEYLYADTRDELKKAIRENIHYGALVIKLVIDDQRYIYSVDDLKFAVEEARLAGLKVCAHSLTHAGAHNAAEAGIASIEHGFDMTDDDLRLAKKNHVVLCGTDFPAEGFIIGYHLPEQAAQSIHAKIVDRLKRAHRIGVTLAFGADVVFSSPDRTRGEWCISFIESWIEAGIPPLETLRAMTTNAAALLGVESRRGAIRPGMAADIIAVPGDPLQDIRALKMVTFVMKDGKVVRPVVQ